jgi:riboflavin kinase/FMN adenylyltransferase
MFDGVHLGHQQVIRQTVADAKQHNSLSLAITFDRHPATVVAPSRAPQLIYSLEHKLREIERLGVDAILVIEFTREFSQQPAEAFVRKLCADLGRIHSVCVGRNFTFGHKRSGNVELLQKLGSELGFQVHGLAAVSLNGQVVSSTRIREAIRSGNLDSASQMLGRSYSIRGAVVRGDHLGRKLGFPTANIDVTGLELPPHGVYAVLAETPQGSRQGLVNIGLRPTVSQPQPQVRFELHLLGFDGELYGQALEVTPLKFLRSEQRFAGLDELKAQIARDVANARAFFADFV